MKMNRNIKILEEFKNKLSAKYKRVEILMFGSHAKNFADKESDIDVAVIIDGNVDWHVRETIYDMAYEIGLEYDIVFDVVIYSKKDWKKLAKSHPLVISAEKEGIVV